MIPLDLSHDEPGLRTGFGRMIKFTQIYRIIFFYPIEITNYYITMINHYWPLLTIINILIILWIFP